MAKQQAQPKPTRSGVRMGLMDQFVEDLVNKYSREYIVFDDELKENKFHKTTEEILQEAKRLTDMIVSPSESSLNSSKAAQATRNLKKKYADKLILFHYTPVIAKGSVQVDNSRNLKSLDWIIENVEAMAVSINPRTTDLKVD